MKNQKTITDFQVKGPCAYVTQRDNLIAEIINNTQIAWPGDKEMKSIAVSACVVLEIAEPDQKFIDGLRGFMVYCRMTNQKASSAMSTILHDLHEFNNNRHEKWFSPRTSRYDKYLTGASGN